MNAGLRSEGALRRRHPAAGGYARGRATQAKIVAAALEIFGACGFDGASTRMIADKAGVNLPALSYYFGDKAGVYRACAEHIAERIAQHIGPAVGRIGAVLADARATREQLLAALQDFVGAFADLVIGGREPENWVLFIVREQASPTAAFDILFDRVMQRAVRTCAAIVGRLHGRPADDPAVMARALTLMGQVLIFRTAREATLRVLGWRDFRGRHLAFLKDTLQAQIAASFGTGEGRR